MEQMRDVLRNSLSKSLRTLGAIDRLAAAWPVVAGSAIAAHSEVMVYEEGTVVLYVDDPAWRPQLESMCGKLVGDLKKVAGVPITGLRFEMRPRPGFVPPRYTQK
ncbi:DUF721 domain-containing protein [Terriglobus tenax]|uniref:DUF721 domain-containing protein n=1 Tax=Terriglobus tenax TaxID=1111115 RepID=UPI0021E0E975|nr:DUF721 domain-containing protein [Terriglobus tenax]